MAKWLGWSCALACVFATQRAAAQENLAYTPEKLVSAGVLLGFGIALGKDYNPWGIGIGARAGYNIQAIYVGARFVFHLGTTDSSVGVGLNAVEIGYSLWELGVEAGYDMRVVDKLTLRPGAVLGVISAITDNNDPLFAGSSSQIKVELSPGISALYDVTDEFFAGGDLRLPLAIGGGVLFGLVLYANGGVHF
ncbi:MAG TPA: outer membrane beta-barrel protein [Polyangiales bacterium]|nr:outer membrane beta-barrel protein [Polyangiales bacterium]